MAEVIAEGPLHPALARRHESLQHELGVGGNEEPDRPGLHHPRGRAADPAGHRQLVEAFRKGKDRGHHEDRVAAQNHGGFERHAPALGFGVVAAASLHALPVHPRLRGPEDLEPVQAEVPAARRGIVGQCRAPGDEPAAVARPGLEVRHAIQRRRLDNGLHGSLRPHRQPRKAHPGKRRTGRPEGLERRRIQAIEQPQQLLADLAGVTAEGDLDAPHRAEKVRDELEVRAPDALEQHGRPALPHDPLRDLGDLEIGVDLDAHARKLLTPFEVVDVTAQIREETGTLRPFRFHNLEPNLPSRKPGIMSDSPYIGPRARRPSRLRPSSRPARSYPGDSLRASPLVQTHQGERQGVGQDSSST